METILLLCVFAFLSGFLMTWSVGANDLANLVSPCIGAQAISIRSAIILVIVFELAGAMFGGGAVSHTIRHELIPIWDFFSSELLGFGMLSVTLASVTWMVLGSRYGLPVSITHSVVGSILGIGVVLFGWQQINWTTVVSILCCWFAGPLLAGFFSYYLMTKIQRRVFGSNNPMKSIRYFFPFYLFLVCGVLGYLILQRVLFYFWPAMGKGFVWFLIFLVAFFGMAFGYFSRNRNLWESDATLRDQFHHIETKFALLVRLAACALVFAHGCNDVPVAVSPVTIVYHLALHESLGDVAVPAWILCMGGFGVLLGLFMYGHKVIVTVGSKITQLTPSRAFSAILSSALIMGFASAWGIPLSVTQIMVGAVFGVGFARGIGAINLRTVQKILFMWIITIPTTGLLSLGYYEVIRYLFYGGY